MQMTAAEAVAVTAAEAVPEAKAAAPDKVSGDREPPWVQFIRDPTDPEPKPLQNKHEGPLKRLNSLFSQIKPYHTNNL